MVNKKIKSFFKKRVSKSNNDQLVPQPYVISGEKSNIGSSQALERDIRYSQSQAPEHDIKSSQAPKRDIKSSQSQDLERDIESSQAHEQYIKSAQVLKRPCKVSRVETKKFDASSLEHDLGLRKSIWDYPPNQHNEIRRAYIKFGPYHPIPPSEAPTPFQYIDKNGCQFLPSWYKLFLDWLEFSLSKNVAYCFPCFLFNKPFGVVEILLQVKDFDHGRKSMKDLNVLLLLMWVRMQILYIRMQ
ncbi:hypothetical protein J1N35_043029 [Gossypium stocksii]|uniref:Uncharacterized protein n=1 Tax=Gossypium stocksii TaxID=47602 RepID=A0A9D3U6P3_9ROSI|nr:hypothetical protein J1N35_043029 [Gossypium stocksii]